MSKPVTSSLTDDEVADIITLAENTFGVYPGNVEAEVSYEITGTVNADFDGSDYSEEELIVAVQNSIADALSIHSSDVEVSIDKTGEIMYTISSATAEDATALQDVLQEQSTSQAITAAVSDVIPAVTKVTKVILF